MVGTHRSILSRSGFPSLRSLLRTWRPRQGGGTDDDAAPPQDPLVALGQQLRQRREERGLSLRELALRTLISTTVLEALERGWRDRLPEKAYLRRMLPLIEADLELPRGSLTPALPAASTSSPSHGFTPGELEVFSSWQGTVLYGLLTLGLIYALNLEQQRLAALGLLALRPVPAQPAPAQDSADQALLRSFPELRPLDLASRGQGLRLLAAPSASPVNGGMPGLLELDLAEPSRLVLSGGGGMRSTLEAAQGQLRLPLTPPWELQLAPAPQRPDQVRWNGQELPTLPGRPGQFAVPGPRPAAAASRP
jgi:transcriptional regulator with XRE-family HTH domain